MSGELMTKDEAISALLAFAFSGAIGSPTGKGVGYSLIEETPTFFSWSATLEDLDERSAPLDRYWIHIDRQSKEISPPKLIEISEAELSKVVLSATNQHLATSTRFTDGALSISYKVTVQENPDIAYVVQLRHHGNVASMDLLMRLVSKTIDSRILPVPTVYPIPGEKERQDATRFGRQITRLMPGEIALNTYPGLAHNDKLVFVKKMALAFQACWNISLPEPFLIGELVATKVDDEIVLSVIPDRHHSLGGPFSSVREYLRAYIKTSLVALEKQEGIEEYKETYLERIRTFVNNGMHSIPPSVESVPVVALHSDMGLHNVLISNNTHVDIEAVIDWEFVASAPFVSLHRILEMFFRRSAPNGFGPEYEHADELREAFWEAIPEWQVWMKRQCTRDFLEWFQFGLFMVPPWRPMDLPEKEAQEYWQENIRVVEGILHKHWSE